MKSPHEHWIDAFSLSDLIEDEPPEPMGVLVGAPVKSLATMTPAERAEMVRLYGPISPATKRRLKGKKGKTPCKRKK